MLRKRKYEKRKTNKDYCSADNTYTSNYSRYFGLFRIFNDTILTANRKSRQIVRLPPAHYRKENAGKISDQNFDCEKKEKLGKSIKLLLICLKIKEFSCELTVNISGNILQSQRNG